MNNEAPILAVNQTAGRASDGKFAPGAIAGPGRPKGALSGRSQALGVLDKIMAEAGTQDALEAAMRKEFNTDPCRFFRSYIMPLLPQEQKIKVAQAEGVVQWTSLLTQFPLEQESTAPTPE